MTTTDKTRAKRAQPKKKRGRPRTGTDPSLTFRCPAELRAAAERAADREGLSLSAWIVAAIRRATES